ncbi:alpha/beta hydrolase family protein [Micromonospora sp. RHAY321]|uniref:alpha/beta hydrolase n=1 Tax=Micromonospora sp. RHAY321 TaxID=2944807 RepID=UPI00207D27C3|nr:alpha/beta hydrolase [Micromonospora sp. RHAY321]MCO1599423.1 alpha/beta hydrolase family protein [Micromonospora sp. RHAY321]
MRRRGAGRLALAVLLGVNLVLPGRAEPAAAAGFVEAYPVTAAAMRAAGPPYADWVAVGRRFLRFDPRGDGRAVEVLGDLAEADRIAVLVPGVGSTLADFDRGLGGVAHRAPAVQAEQLYEVSRRADPTARVAVLAWLGYGPPDGVLTAAGGAGARRGAVAMAALLRELAERRPAATITLIGHSYGSLVVSLAAADAPPQVTDVVSLGGIGAGVQHADELPGGARFWAAEAPTDWIRRVPPVRLLGLGYGRRPGDPAFGARPLPVAGVAGHDGYLVPGSATLVAVAAVVRDGADAERAGNAR